MLHASTWNALIKVKKHASTEPCRRRKCHWLLPWCTRGAQVVLPVALVPAQRRDALMFAVFFCGVRYGFVSFVHVQNRKAFGASKV
jgi:hypothetical protein